MNDAATRAMIISLRHQLDESERENKDLLKQLNNLRQDEECLQKEMAELKAKNTMSAEENATLKRKRIVQEETLTYLSPTVCPRVSMQATLTNVDCPCHVMIGWPMSGMFWSVPACANPRPKKWLQF
jgi:uncharacterized protein YhaN